MKKGIIIGWIFIVICCFSCGQQSKESKLEFFPITKMNFQKFLNKKRSFKARADLSKDIHLVNNDYPIEISLYEDGSWYYNLENLGDGIGSWKYSNGKLELFAERILFDMYIDIEALDKEVNSVAIKFSDRHGPKVLKMENRNLKK